MDDAGRGLSLAVTIPQFKIVSDVAAAQEIFAARQGLGEDVIGYAHALKTEALAGLGELIKESPKATGARGIGKKPKSAGPGVTRTQPPTLAEQGVNKKTANLARKIASLSDADRKAVAGRKKTLAAVSREKTARDRKKRISLPDAKFRVVYADPAMEVQRLGRRWVGSGRGRSEEVSGYVDRRAMRAKH